MRGAVGTKLALAALLLVVGCRPRGHEAEPEHAHASKPAPTTASSSAPKEPFTMMDTLFESAVASSGQAYLDADRKLRDSGTLAEPTLRKNLHNPDPIARLLARTTLDWLEGSAQDYQAVLDYLEYLPNRLARTPVGNPPPLGVASYLSLHFGARAVDFLAARLVKGTDWPHWKVVGVIFYLKEQARPSATEALLRFAAETPSAEWRGFAIEAIEAARDPDLKAKVAVERQYQASRGKQLPPALEALAAPRP